MTTMHANDMSAVVDALRAHDRFVVTSHDNPDGDAIGPLLATHLALGQLGKDSVMVVGGTAPFPDEYRLELDRHGVLRRRPPTSSSGLSSPWTARRRAASSSRRCWPPRRSRSTSTTTTTTPASGT